MAQAKDFSEFYNLELTELLTPLDRLRKKAAAAGITGFIFLPCTIAFFIIATNAKSAAAGIAAFVFLVMTIIFLVIYHNRKKDYRSAFKQDIIHSIIRFIDPTLHYNPAGHINRADYDNSGLYLQNPDRFSGDDYVEGKRDKTFFCFSELHTQRKVQSGKSSHWETIFKGLFFIGDFNKHFHGRTYVYSEKNPQLGFFTKLFSSFAWNLEKVKLESPEFENIFAVYSNDQVEARYILTPSFMERLMKLQAMMGHGTSYSFVNTNVYVAVPMKNELFEPSVFSANDYNKLGNYFNTIHSVFDIIDELNLNLRIWTKE